jgi:hypothetical protein
MEINSYKCTTPIVIIIFNRLLETQRLIEAISKVQPTKLYIISDGPRENFPLDKGKVESCRQLIDSISWNCELVKLYSDINLGCMKRVVTGLNSVFQCENSAIILEDDCIPSVDFFKFCEWGLFNFQKNENIGLISGSNLIADKFDLTYMNGFSKYINIWGWATWKSTWEKYDNLLTIMDVQNNIGKFSKLKLVEKIFWKELFKLSIYSSKIWDFRLQYTFFMYDLYSVYPKKSLVENIGFGVDATHTSINKPKYVLNNLPENTFNLFEEIPDYSFAVDSKRENLYIKTIWNYSLLTTIRLKIMNVIRLFK